jgi:F-type H+-transporting ATPase subunit a
MGPGIAIIPAITKPHVSLAAETLFHIGPIPVTNSMLTMFLVMIGLVLFFALATRRMQRVPRGVQNVAEAIVEMLLNLVEGTAGRRVGRTIFPLIATLFIFILTANYAGLLPGVGTIGFYEEGDEPAHTRVVDVASADGQAAAAPAQAQEEPARVLVPFFRAPNADLNMTIAKAILAVVVVQVSGIVAHGVGGYLKELATPIFLFPIHVVGEFSRIISLSARLFGNIFGGEVLLAVIIALTSWVFVIPAIFYGLELFFGLVQALIFSLLTLIYITLAVAGHGDHGEHGEHDDASDAVQPGAETGAHLGA